MGLWVPGRVPCAFYIRASWKWRYRLLLGQTVACRDTEGYPDHCRVLGSILGLCPPDAGGVPLLELS